MTISESKSSELKKALRPTEWLQRCFEELLTFGKKTVQSLKTGLSGRQQKLRVMEVEPLQTRLRHHNVCTKNTNVRVKITHSICKLYEIS